MDLIENNESWFKIWQNFTKNKDYKEKFKVFLPFPKMNPEQIQKIIIGMKHSGKNEAAHPDEEYSIDRPTRNSRKDSARSKISRPSSKGSSSGEGEFKRKKYHSRINSLD